MSEQRKKLFFSFLLLITAAIWGSGFLVMQNVMESVSLNFTLSVRFTVAAVGLSYFIFKSEKGVTPLLVKHGIITGFLIYVAYAVQSYGLDFTTVGKNAVLTSLSTVMVPFIAWLIRRTKISPVLYGAAFACVIGTGLISLPDKIEAFNIGDLLAFAGSILYALHIVAVSICSEDSEIMPLTCMQFVFAAIFAWIVTFSTNAVPDSLSSSTILGIAWLSVMATLLAITMMNIGIKFVDPTRTALILSTESLFAYVLGVIFKNEPVTVRIVSGVVIIIGAIIVSQLASAGNETKADKAKKADTQMPVKKYSQNTAPVSSQSALPLLNS